MAAKQQPGLLVVAGGTTPAAAAGVERVIGHLRAERAGTAGVHHDLREVAKGVVHRRLRFGRSDDAEVLELMHGCVSCTLREDVLPPLVGLARKPRVTQIVLHLDPVLEPEQVCWAVLHVLVDAAVVADLVDLRGVISVVDVETRLDDATCDDDVTERELALLPGDERAGPAHRRAGGVRRPARLHRHRPAVADHPHHGRTQPPGTTGAPAPDQPARPAPPAPRPARHSPARTAGPPHTPLLHGQPALAADLGVRHTVFTARRPFHPERLHRALDALLVGVVRARGRLWLATRPNSVLWLESAGGGLRIGHVGDWLTSGGDDDGDQAHPERRAAAALRGSRAGATACRRSPSSSTAATTPGRQARADGRPEAPDIAQQHPSPPSAVEGNSTRPRAGGHQ